MIHVADILRLRTAKTEFLVYSGVVDDAVGIYCQRRHSSPGGYLSQRTTAPARSRQSSQQAFGAKSTNVAYHNEPIA